jgi:uncharacterized membrane protein YfcA
MDTLSLFEWVSVGAVFAAAGLLRGFTGFGFALVAVPFGALWLPPDIIIPVIFLLHVYMGLFEVPRVARTCRPGSLIWMMAGSAAGTPIGVLALVVMPARAVYLVIGAIVIVSLVPLLFQPARRHMPAGAGAAAGFLAGIFNGMAAMPGPPAIYYFMRGLFTHAEARASLIIFFFSTSLCAVLATLYAGLLRREEVLISLGAFPIIAVSGWIGARLFARYGGHSYRQVSILCLAGAAIAAFAKALG